MGWSGLFSYVGMRELVKYLQSFNLASQTLAAKSSGASPDLKTTGTAPAWLNGAFISAVTVQATIDLSLAAQCEVAGEVMANEDIRWLLVCQKADGTTYCYDAGSAAAPVIPNWNSALYVPVGLAKIAATGALTIGTTNLTADTDLFVYQLTGPVFPDTTKMDRN